MRTLVHTGQSPNRKRSTTALTLGVPCCRYLIIASFLRSILFNSFLAPRIGRIHDKLDERPTRYIKRVNKGDEVAQWCPSQYKYEIFVIINAKVRPNMAEVYFQRGVKTAFRDRKNAKGRGQEIVP